MEGIIRDVYPAKLEMLPLFLDTVRRAAEKAGVRDKKLKEAELVAEEALTNIFSHGYQEQAGLVEISCGSNGADEFVIRIIDQGIPWDINTVQAPDLAASIGDGELGGLGIHLIKQIVHDVSFQREGNSNILTMTIKTPAEEEPQPPLILTKFDGPIGTITFNNQKKRNSLCNALLNELLLALIEMKNRKTLVVIIRAEAGAKVWSSGFDISELPESGRDPLSYHDPLEQVLRRIQSFPSPVIAMVEGGVWGGACELSFTADIVIGCPSATFAITPAKIGVPYNPSGILHFINVAGARTAREMFFTAKPISAERAYDLGIINHLVPADELESFTYDMARQIAMNSPLSISVIKEQLRILSGSNAISPETFERIQGLRRLVYNSNDYREGIRSFLEKRPPVFRGD
jgi:methylmalonyl-CoA decarboxylase